MPTKRGSKHDSLNFHQWVNDELLPSYHLPPELSHCISLHTALQWLHKLVFALLVSRIKGAFVDGHEREDVVACRAEFLMKMKVLKELHLPPPPCSDEPAATPPPDAAFKKLVLIYHNQSIFSTNEGQQWIWASEDMPVLKPKMRG